MSQVSILEFSQHNLYPNSIVSKGKLFSKIQSRSHFIQTVFFEISKTFGSHYRESWNPFEILTNLTSVRWKIYWRISTCQWFFTLTLQFDFNSLILGRPTFWGPQTYILTTTRYFENFIKQIYDQNLSNHNSGLWSKIYIHNSLWKKSIWEKK